MDKQAFDKWVDEQEAWYGDMLKLWQGMARSERWTAYAFAATAVGCSLLIAWGWAFRCGGTVDTWPIILSPGMAFYGAVWQWMEAGRSERQTQRVLLDHQGFRLRLVELRRKEGAGEDA